MESKKADSDKLTEQSGSTAGADAVNTPESTEGTKIVPPLKPDGSISTPG
jgi:hypothetical protein